MMLTPILFLGGDAKSLCQEAFSWGGWGTFSSAELTKCYISQ